MRLNRVRRPYAQARPARQYRACPRCAGGAHRPCGARETAASQPRDSSTLGDEVGDAALALSEAAPAKRRSAGGNLFRVWFVNLRASRPGCLRGPPPRALLARRVPRGECARVAGRSDRRYGALIGRGAKRHSVLGRYVLRLDAGCRFGWDRTISALCGRRCARTSGKPFQASCEPVGVGSAGTNVCRRVSDGFGGTGCGPVSRAQTAA
jgi:hypothetical protein